MADNYYTATTEFPERHPRRVAFAAGRGVSSDQSIKKSHIKQSKHLPVYLWFFIAKVLGIRLQPAEKPIAGTVLYVVSFTAALLFAVSYVWHAAYDIKSKYTKQTLMVGSAQIIGALYWSSLGIYANQLAFKLFSSQRFFSAVRMHSKTFFKINAAWILAIVGLAFTALNGYSLFEEFMLGHSCATIGLARAVCQVMFVSRVIHSILTLLWNLLVGLVLLSVCRTHTIGLRRFTRALDQDGRHLEEKRRMTSYPPTRNHSGDGNTEGVFFGNTSVPAGGNMGYRTNSYHTFDIVCPASSSGGYLWDEEFSSLQEEGTERQDSPVEERELTEQTRVRGNYGSLNGRSGSFDQPESPSGAGQIQIDQSDVPGADHVGEMSNESGDVEEGDKEEEEERQRPRNLAGQGSWSEASVGGDEMSPAPITRALSLDDIMGSYYRIGTHVRLTSLVLQRWLASWLILILLWVFFFILYWLHHTVTLTGIFEALLPVLLLPVVCFAYAEVNTESRRMIRAIYPTKERLDMLLYMDQAPLQMSIFGFELNYSAIATVAFGLLVAVSSRFIIDQLNA